MPWLQYDVMEVDPDAQAEWEAENYQAGVEYNKAVEAAEKVGDPAPDAPEPKAKPEPEKATKQVEVASEARLTGVNTAGNYFNISLDLNGVTKVEVMEEPPAEEEEATPVATKTTTKATSSS